jgi:hypothetical protein
LAADERGWREAEKASNAISFTAIFASDLIGVHPRKFAADYFLAVK